MLFDFRPKVAIHCWGGLGSQLYAWALRLELEAAYPSRKFFFVTHEGGVTRRFSELTFFYPTSTKAVPDYREKVTPINIDLVSYGLRKIIKSLSTRMLYMCGFLVDGDSADPLRQLKGWSFQIRGHYSHRKISPAAISSILATLVAHTPSARLDTLIPIALHYRLGDLQTLADKKPLEFQRIVSALETIPNVRQSPIHLFSDSLADAQSLFTNSGFDYLDTSESSLIVTLLDLVGSRIFIGSNSKLSVWSVLFKSCSNIDSLSFLPFEVEHHIVANAGNSLQVTYF
jgi:hypothetical protein